MAESLRLLAVHAHPDDESSKGAAMMARYVESGARVLVATCTGGERGELLNEKLDLAGRAIAEVRQEEMARAAQILGIEHTWLGFEDSGFPDPESAEPPPPGSFAAIELSVAVAPLVQLVREFRPHVMVTYDEMGGYPHPDHIRTHEISVAAFEAAADPHYPGEQPWAVRKLYYDVTFHLERLQRLHDAVIAAGGESPYDSWLEGWKERPPKSDRVTTRVDCSDHFGVREAALRAHATQVDPDGMWFKIPLDVHQQVWPTEDFELAATRVPVALPEDDLFAGIDPVRPDEQPAPGPVRWLAPRHPETR